MVTAGFAERTRGYCEETLRSLGEDKSEAFEYIPARFKSSHCTTEAKLRLLLAHRPGTGAASPDPIRAWLGSPGWACVCFTFSISRMTIIKTSTSYFACASPATTAANLSSDWFMPST
jgi:hypothetical protein